jgi:hypothetical protein
MKGEYDEPKALQIIVLAVLLAMLAIFIIRF